MNRHFKRKLTKIRPGLKVTPRIKNLVSPRFFRIETNLNVYLFFQTGSWDGRLPVCQNFLTSTFLQKLSRLRFPKHRLHRSFGLLGNMVFNLNFQDTALRLRNNLLQLLKQLEGAFHLSVFEMKPFNQFFYIYIPYYLSQFIF